MSRRGQAPDPSFRATSEHEMISLMGPGSHLVAASVEFHASLSAKGARDGRAGYRVGLTARAQAKGLSGALRGSDRLVRD
jgi:hypothetical protein